MPNIPNPPPTIKTEVEDVVCEVDMPNENESNSMDYEEGRINSSNEEEANLVENKCHCGSNENNMLQIEWTWSERDVEPVLHVFSEQEELRVNLHPDITSTDVFSLFFDDDLMEKIVNWTNIQSVVLRKTTMLTSHSNLKKWTDLTSDEMKKFFGLCIMMGNIRMPTLKEYWNTNVLYYHPLFGKTMCRDRFETILRCLKFYEDPVDKKDRLHEIRFVLNRFVENVRKIYYPGQNLSVDDPLLLWRGRLVYNQPAPQEKANQEMWIHDLCTPDGFVLNMFFDDGKTPSVKGLNNTSSVAYHLLKDYLGKGHTIYMSSHYSEVPLGASLYKDDTHFVGMLRKHRKGNPAFVVNKPLKRGESVYARKDPVLVQKWRDKQDIIAISTKHSALFTEVRCRSGRIVSKPAAVASYNENMFCGLDRADQMISHYFSPQKSMLWYTNLFFHLLDIMIWNACWLYNRNRIPKITYLDFRNDLAKRFLNNEHKIAVPVEPTMPPGTRHYPIKLDRRIRCHVCAARKHRTATKYACDTCITLKGLPVGLCVDKCFKIYHESQ